MKLTDGIDRDIYYKQNIVFLTIFYFSFITMENIILSNLYTTLLSTIWSDAGTTVTINENTITLKARCLIHSDTTLKLTFIE